MKISTKSARSTSSLTPTAHAAGGTIIHSRPPIFALTTSLSCFLIAWLFSFRSSWRWCGALMGLAGLLVVWQIHIASNAPTLVVRGLIATLYRKGVAAGSFVLSDLSIVEGNLTIGFA